MLYYKALSSFVSIDINLILMQNYHCIAKVYNSILLMNLILI